MERKSSSTNPTSMAYKNAIEQLGLKEYQNADLVVGFGRRNPNAQRGRERRGKKKKNKNARFFWVPRSWVVTAAKNYTWIFFKIRSQSTL